MHCHRKHVFLLEELYPVAIGDNKKVVSHYPFLQINSWCLFTRVYSYWFFHFINHFTIAAPWQAYILKHNTLIFTCCLQATHRLSLLPKDIQAWMKNVIFTMGMHLIYSLDMWNGYSYGNIFSHKLPKVVTRLASKDLFSKLGEVRWLVLQHPAKRRSSKLGKVSSRCQEQEKCSIRRVPMERE